MTTFSRCLAACGLSLDEAVTVLGQSRSTIEKKSAGSREMTADDADVLGSLWHKVRTGKVEGLPEGAREMSRAMQVLWGVEAVPERRRGRKPKAG